MSNMAAWRLAILAKMAILVKLAILAKIPRGLSGDNGKNRPGPWRMVILAKMAKIARRLVISRMWQIFKLDAKSSPFKLDN